MIKKALSAVTAVTAVAALTLLAVFAFSSVAQAGAGAGVTEINQVCAIQTGCFPGDTPGFPVQITASSPSNFVLTSDLTLASAAEGAIQIATSKSDVSIDLGGFTIAGPNNCTEQAPPNLVSCTATSGGSGISALSFAENIFVHNGTIRGMGRYGVEIFAQGSRVRDLRIKDCAGGGVILGRNGHIEATDVNRTRGTGIRVGETGSVRNSIVRWARDGFNIGNASRLEGSHASNNANAGIVGTHGSVIQGNTSVESGFHGIEVYGDGAIIRGNTVRDSASHGIKVDAMNLIDSNTVTGSRGKGIDSGDANIISGNNVSRSNGDGIFATDGSTIRGNTVFENGTSLNDEGIHCTLGCTVQANSIRANAGLGLRFDSGSSLYTQNAIGANNGGGTVQNGRDGGANVCGTTLTCP